MNIAHLLFTTLAAGLLLPSIKTHAGLNTLEHYQKKAQQYHSTIKAPVFAKTPEEIKKSLLHYLAVGDMRGDAIARFKKDEVSFENTVGALDDLFFRIGSDIGMISILKNASPDPAIREAAAEALKKYDQWEVSLNYREDIYEAIKSYADIGPSLEGEKAKLFIETLLDYKRNGFDLSKEAKGEIELLKKRLSELSNDFDTNIADASRPLTFTAKELAGVPESFLNQEGIKTGEDEYTLMANITWHFLTVMRNARKEDTRKRMKIARYSLAREKNIQLLSEILKTRGHIASKLGYASWGDYRTETRMAGNTANVLSFLENLNSGLKPKFKAEIAAFQALKAKDTGHAKAEIKIWDWRYYRNQYMKEKYQVDAEALKVFFPYEATLEGMFGIYEETFGLEIEEIVNPYRWHKDVTLHVVSDSETGEPLGLFYLDMFPRPGKYNHFAQFSIIDARRLPNGQKQRPTVALICNFPTPGQDKPSLLSPDDVETLFHEFGHVLHSVLTQANYYRFSGTSVPRDFVEAPSQMLEYWLQSKEVLDRFAADYRDPSKKIPAETITRIIEAKKATVATTYSRQLLFATMDMSLHGPKEAEEEFDLLKVSNQFFESAFLPAPENSAFVAYFGHLTGYDAGYYGYAWADVIAADMASVFENAPGGYLDPKVGRRLRNEIYATGDSRDVRESIETFLGRQQSMKPFLKKLGIE